MTENKCHWIRQLGWAYYYFCIESTKKNTPVYELQHQMGDGASSDCTVITILSVVSLELKREYYLNCFILASCYLFNGHS